MGLGLASKADFGRKDLPGWHTWVPTSDSGVVTSGLQPVVEIPEESMSLPVMPKGWKVAQF